MGNWMCPWLRLQVGDRAVPHPGFFGHWLSVAGWVKAQLPLRCTLLFWPRSLNQSKLKVWSTVLTSVCILYECFWDGWCCFLLHALNFFCSTFECLMQIDLAASVFRFSPTAMESFLQVFLKRICNSFKLQLSPPRGPCNLLTDFTSTTPTSLPTSSYKPPVSSCHLAAHLPRHTKIFNLNYFS